MGVSRPLGRLQNQGEHVDSEKVEYQAESATALVDELFSGKFSIADSLQRLRTRLLDLSSRNRLLSYRHPKKRCVQFVDNPDLNLLFERMLDGKNILLKPVPDPDPFDYEGSRKPEPRQYAERVRISTAYEFPEPKADSSSYRRTPALQALLYPAELDKLLRKISSEARTVIEETGTNMLYLMFGFLEFYHQDSEQPFQAPLLSVPTALTRGAIDPNTRAYQYTLALTGEGICENQTLREKLKQDFRLNLPELEEEETPEGYLAKIAQAVRNQKRWKVRRQLTLGFLSFGKLAIWVDMDPKKWPSLLEHPLLKRVFEGGGTSSTEGGFHAEDYEIDQHAQADLPLIYDADSSQHSAIIDVLAGKDMVINGPPGTGKSQTITNIIASALSQGKKVLFVSEKLAALEVVRHRLEMANLGHFCLELHSHKTQKKRLLEDISARIEERYRQTPFIKEKLAALVGYKKRLNRYAELMGSRIGNERGMTIHEVFWAAERRRQKLGDQAERLSSVLFRDAPKWAYWELEQHRTRIESLSLQYTSIRGYGSFQPWWGFSPRLLNPGDDVELGRIIAEALIEAEKLVNVSADYAVVVRQSAAPSLEALYELANLVEGLPPPPQNLNANLLPRLFADDDPNGQKSRKTVNRLAREINGARNLFAQANLVLVENAPVEFVDIEPAKSAAEATLAPSTFGMPIEELGIMAAALASAAEEFEGVLATVSAPYTPIHRNALTGLRSRLDKLSNCDVRQTSLRDIDACRRAVMGRHRSISEALQRVTDITHRFSLPFDATPASVAQLAKTAVLDGVLPGIRVDAALVGEAMRHAKGNFRNLSIAKSQHCGLALTQILGALRSAFDEIKNTSSKVDLSFGDTYEDVAQFGALVTIAQHAPQDLLEHRQPNFDHHRLAELAIKAEQAKNAERAMRSRLGQNSYLDALPPTAELKASSRVFRRGDSILNFLSADWRAARKLLRGVSKSKGRKSAQTCEEQLNALVAWREHCESFEANREFKDGFGSLFAGLETDFDKIRRLHAWYALGQTELLAHPGLVEKVDLSTLDKKMLAQIAARGTVLQHAVSVLRSASEDIRNILSTETGTLADTQTRSWPTTFEGLEAAIASLSEQMAFFSRLVQPAVSPSRAAELLQASLELQKTQPDIETLVAGKNAIAEATGAVLVGLKGEQGSNWVDYLEKVRTTCVNVEVLVEYLKEYVVLGTSPEGAERFIEAKLQLDTAWAELATSGKANDVTTWQEFASRAKTAVAIARNLHDSVAEHVRAGASAGAAISAIRARDTAKETLTRLTSDPEIQRVAGDVFAGERTNLDALSNTHDWGSQITKLASPKHDSLRRQLLCADAPGNLALAKSLLTGAREAADNLRSTLAQLERFGKFDWDTWQQPARRRAGEDLPSDVRARLELAFENMDSVLAWSKYLSARDECITTGLKDLVAGLESGQLHPSNLGLAFEFVAYQSMGKSIYKKYPELSRFAGSSHEKLCEEFVALDREIIKANGLEFGYRIDKNKRVVEGGTGTRAGDYTEMNLLRRELNKQRRHIPIRQLIKRAGRTLQELKPCFMMGPLSVAQYLEPGAIEFDLVVMDEASQLRPEEALGAIARGKQLVVVGDPKQLPPTSFFDRLMDGGEDEETDDTPTVLAGMESILDICQQLFHPVRTLRWHYRSRHESLIAFSNHHFYKNLIVFPSPYAKGTRLGVRYHYVRNGAYKDRQNLPEAQLLVDAVVDHMIRRPDESLGVVTLNQTQRELIEELLDKRLRTFEEGQQFLTTHEGKGWPFFVKNLENVQGDERDVIFISTTFGKAAGTDKVRQNFGPISRPDGWRRLNVLFTRARYRVTLFTSMRPEDIIVDEKTPAGTKALHDYLDYATRGILTTTDEGDREPDSDFEVAVANVLVGRGYTVKPQFGVAGFFIDLAVRNPDRPGEFIAGIECDGATYHSSASARDRDRIRQEILEGLGWDRRIYRIWSTDWFFDPRRETRKLIDFLERRRALSQSETASPFEEVELTADGIDEMAGSVQGAPDAGSNQSDEVVVADTADLFVEVGDRVTYCFVADASDRHSVLIVDSASNPKMNVLNENTSLAKALLGLTPGEEAVLEVPGQPGRKLRVLKIQRGDEALR